MRLCANTAKVSFVFYLTPYIVLKVKLAHTKNPVKIPSVEAKGVELTQNIICGWKVQKPIHMYMDHSYKLICEGTRRELV
jgi:hypothetical protein